MEEVKKQKQSLIHRLFKSRWGKNAAERQTSTDSRVVLVKDQDKDTQISFIDPPNIEDETVTYVSYPERWWMLLTVVLLNLANYSHWVAFPSVTKQAAVYYDQSGERMDLIPTLSYAFGIPCCLMATYAVDKYGLKMVLRIGGIFTGVGGLLCFVSSMPYLSEAMSSDAQFYLAVIGQALTGIACPFISCVPTKISQHWFCDKQRAVATILIGMANPLGIVLGQGVTPLMVRAPEDVPLMNVVWFIPAGIGAVLTLWKVRREHPPTPPSPSAALAQKKGAETKSYIPNVKALVKNKAFVVLVLFVGGAMGYISCISTKIEQIMCARGYSDQLSGLSGALILFVGFFASFPMGIIGYKTGRLTAVCKVCGIGGIFSMCLIAYFMRLPDVGVAIAVSCALLGVFALGCYPSALELIVESTYPIDQATGTAFLFLSSAVQGVFLMLVENGLGTPLSEEEMAVQTCVKLGEEGHQQPKDYSSYLYFITAYMSTLVVVFIVFFKTELKRSLADKEQKSSPIVRQKSTATMTTNDLENGLEMKIDAEEPEAASVSLTKGL